MSKDERIKLNINTQVKDASKKIELPINILVLSKVAKNDLSVRRVNKKNFNAVMRDVNPSLSYTVLRYKNQQEELKVNLQFKELKDFRPERVAMNIPEIRRLLGVRSMIKYIKDKSITNKRFLADLQGVSVDV